MTAYVHLRCDRCQEPTRDWAIRSVGHDGREVSVGWLTLPEGWTVLQGGSVFCPKHGEGKRS